MAIPKQKKKTIWEPFWELRRRNKVLFTILVSAAIIVFWKGVWGLADIFFDEYLFQGHLLWSNVGATIVGFLVLLGAGLVLQKLA